MRTNLSSELIRASAQKMMIELRLKEGGETPQLLEDLEIAQGAVDTLKELLSGIEDKEISDAQLNQEAIQLVIVKTGRTPREITNIIESKVSADAGVTRTKSGVTASVPRQISIPDKESESSARWRRCREDYVYFCKMACTIMYRAGLNPKHPLGGYGSFEVNEHQIRFVAVIIDLWLKGVPVRVILLKARQLGMTTAILAFWVWMMVQKDHFVAFFMIDKDPHMYEKRDMIINWLENLEKLFPEQDIPTIVAKGGKRIVLSNGSKMLFESAHSPNPGTSEMVHAIHLSEKPKWPKGRAALVDKSLLPGMPSAPNTFVVDESTAQGMGEFFKKWDRVMSGKEAGLTKTTPVFLPWYLSPEYSAEPPEHCYKESGEFIYSNEDIEVCETDEVGDISITEEEIANNFNLSVQQIFWRRVTIKNTYKGVRVDFDQEYPTTPGHAWAAVGTLFFGNNLATEGLKLTQEPIMVGNIVDKKGNNDYSRLFSWVHYSPQVMPDRSGPLRIYERPMKGMKYFIGGDVAEGRQIESSSGLDPDFSVLNVDDEFGKTVAVYRGRIKPEEFAHPALLLAILYNQAKVNIERNSVGEACWVMFKQTGYNKVYLRSGHGPYEDRAWNKTLPSNRKTMLIELRHHLRRHPECIVDKNLAYEISKFITNKDGRPEAMSGEHDDCVMAKMHTWHMIYDLVGVRISVKEEVVQEPHELEFSNVLEYNGVELGEQPTNFDSDDFAIMDIF